MGGFLFLARSQSVGSFDAYSELPRALPPYTLQTSFTNTYNVTSASASDLQTKINTARSTSGFSVVNVPVATYNLTSGLNIPASTNGNTGILIRSSNFASLPSQSTPGSTWGAEYRVAAADAGVTLPTLSLSVISNIITIPLSSHNIQFQGIEFTNTVFNVSIVFAGDGAGTNTDSTIIPNNLIFRHCYFHGLAWPNGKGNATARGLRIDAANAAVVDCRFDNIYGELGVESQAILAIAATGPFLIYNNFIQAATENIMFGGGDPPFTSQVPLADITITRNHFDKDINWFNGTSGSTVKNLLEFKFGSRALIEGNVFENLGVQQQGGSGIVINNVSQSGGSLWTTVQDYTFRYNVVRNIGKFMEISANYNAFSPTSSVATAARISVHDNLVYNQGQYLPFTGTLGNNPFTTANGSSDVLVHWVGHPFYNNQQGRIIITGATAVGGLTLNGTFWVRKADSSNAIVDADNFYITAGGNATSTATGGGASATYTAGEAIAITMVFTAVTTARHTSTPFPDYFDGLIVKQNTIISNLGAGNNVLFVGDSDNNNTRWDWQNNILSWGAYGIVDQGLVNFNMLDTYWPGSYTNTGNVYVESDGTAMTGNTVVTGAISTVIPGYPSGALDPGGGYTGKGPDMTTLRAKTHGVVTASTDSIQ